MARTRIINYDAAFIRWVALRDFDKLAKELGVPISSLYKVSTKEGWAGRLLEMERKANDKALSKLQESMDSMSLKHIAAAAKMLNLGLEALRTMPAPITSGEAVKLISEAVKIERGARGEPDKRTSHSIELVLKEHYRDLLGAVGGNGNGAQIKMLEDSVEAAFTLRGADAVEDNDTTEDVDEDNGATWDDAWDTGA